MKESALNAQPAGGPVDDLEHAAAGDSLAAESPDDVGGPLWRSISIDPVLSRPPSPGSPGHVPPGDDLRLDIGWERFEQLLLFVA
jgi:hypothetical protein